MRTPGRCASTVQGAEPYSPSDQPARCSGSRQASTTVARSGTRASLRGGADDLQAGQARDAVAAEGQPAVPLLERHQLVQAAELDHPAVAVPDALPPRPRAGRAVGVMPALPGA